MLLLKKFNSFYYCLYLLPKLLINPFSSSTSTSEPDLFSESDLITGSSFLIPIFSFKFSIY